MKEIDIEKEFLKMKYNSPFRDEPANTLLDNALYGDFIAGVNLASERFIEHLKDKIK